jgi:CHAT domain-containing protein
LGALNYLDFTLQLALTPGAKCRVSVRTSRGEEEEHEISLPFDPGTLPALRANLHEEARRCSRAPRDAGGRHDGPAGAREVVVDEAPTSSVNDFGKKLYDAVFEGPIATLFGANQEYASQAKLGLRVKLVPDATLALIPWELFRTRRGHYLSLSDQTPLVRHVSVNRPQTPLHVAPPLRVLGVLSTGGGEPLDLKRERDLIEAELAPLRRRRLAEIEWLENPTGRDLLEALDRREWHILHFAGHGSFDSGSAQGVLAMASEGGGHAHLRANALRVMLRDRPSLRMVFLNACDGAVGDTQEMFSSTAAIVTEAGVPVVLAMQFPISDDVAARFARHVYCQLAAGDAVEEAVTVARKVISLDHNNPLGWATPVLFMRSAEGASLRVAPRLPESDERAEVGEVGRPPASPSTGPEGSPVPADRPPHAPALPRRHDEAQALPASGSPLARLRHPVFVAAALLAAGALVLVVADGWKRDFGPPNAVARPADVPAASALLAPAQPASASPAALYDWSNPCSLAVGAAYWVARVRSALCDLESKRHASAWVKLDELARRDDLPDDARGIVSKHSSRASQGLGQLLARTSEPPAALTLTLEDGRVVTPNVVTPLDPGRHTLTVSKNGRDVRSVVLQVSPGAVTAIDVPTNRPSSEKATPHGAKICDSKRNCVPL